MLKLDSFKGKGICFGQWSLASDLSGELKTFDSRESAAKRDAVLLLPYPNSQAFVFNSESVYKQARFTQCRFWCWDPFSYCCGLSSPNSHAHSNSPAWADDPGQQAGSMVLHIRSCLARLLLGGGMDSGEHYYSCSISVDYWLYSIWFWLLLPLLHMHSLLVAAEGGPPLLADLGKEVCAFGVL